MLGVRRLVRDHAGGAAALAVALLWPAGARGESEPLMGDGGDGRVGPSRTSAGGLASGRLDASVVLEAGDMGRTIDRDGETKLQSLPAVGGAVRAAVPVVPGLEMGPALQVAGLRMRKPSHLTGELRALDLGIWMSLVDQLPGAAFYLGLRPALTVLFPDNDEVCRAVQRENSAVTDCDALPAVSFSTALRVGARRRVGPVGLFIELGAAFRILRGRTEVSLGSGLPFSSTAVVGTVQLTAAAGVAFDLP